MKYQSGLLKEFPLINFLRPDDLRKLNAIFKTNYQPVKSTARIIKQVRQEELNNEIDKLMRQKPEKGGWGA